MWIYTLLVGAHMCVGWVLWPLMLLYTDFGLDAAGAQMGVGAAIVCGLFLWVVATILSALPVCGL